MSSPVLLSNSITNYFGETIANAQYIGDLNNRGTFSIGLTAALAPKDKGDYYNFRVTTSDNYIRLETVSQSTTKFQAPTLTSTNATTNIGGISDFVKSNELRVQVLTQTGKVIADSDPASGSAYDNYQALASGTSLQVGRGTYTLKVSPGKAADSRATYSYMLSLQASSTPIPDNAQGTEREAFQTTASAATQSTTANAASTTAGLPTVLTPTTASSQLFSALSTYSSSTAGGAVNVLA